MREQVGTLGLNQEVLKENQITGCRVKMQLWETSKYGATAGDQGGLVAGLDQFCLSRWA